MEISVQREDFDAGAEARALTQGRADVGAVVSFVGLCRDEGGALAALEIEHYPGMAEAEIARVVEEARARWPLLGRAGHPPLRRDPRPASRSCWSATASTHRGAAFAAAEFLMDYMKTRAPFWKRARRADGSVEGWVEAKDCRRRLRRPLAKAPRRAARPRCRSAARPPRRGRRAGCSTGSKAVDAAKPELGADEAADDGADDADHDIHQDAGAGMVDELGGDEAG